MNYKRNFFDFLRKGSVNLSEVSVYLQNMGYIVQNLRQPDRHVVGSVADKNDPETKYFFKMASRPELSVFIENEYTWSRIAHHSHRIEKWSISLPKMYTLGKMGKLSWLVAEYIDGKDLARDSNSILSAIQPVAHAIADIIQWKSILQLPLDREHPYATIQDRATERIAEYRQRIDRNKLDPWVICFLEKNIYLLESAPARGDVAPGNIRQDRKGVLWLIDSEFASFKNFKFYDVGYYYFRIAINEERPDIAEIFIKKFKQKYQFTTRDEIALQWLILYRLLGGYYEAKKNASLYPKIDELRNFILRRVKNVEVQA
jgi:thiamine kinase-like enzyme